MEEDHKSEVLPEEENEVLNEGYSRREFLRLSTLGAVGAVMTPLFMKGQMLRDSIEDKPPYTSFLSEILDPEKQAEIQEEKEKREFEQYINAFLNHEYEGKTTGVPIRDDIRFEDGNLIYRMPCEMKDLKKTVPKKETEKGKKDGRRHYPLLAFYFYGSDARFDMKYLTGEIDWSRPEQETKVPILRESEVNLPTNLSETFDVLEITDENIREKKNMIINQFKRNGHGTMYVYLDEKLIMNSRIAGKRRRGTTMGIYEEIWSYTPWKISKKFENFPMPYALHYGGGGEFIHAGNTSGYSHGCTRMEGIKSALLWRLVMGKKGEESEKFGLINIKENQTGADLALRKTCGWKPEFVDEIKKKNLLRIE